MRRQAAARTIARHFRAVSAERRIRTRGIVDTGAQRFIISQAQRQAAVIQRAFRAFRTHVSQLPLLSAAAHEGLEAAADADEDEVGANEYGGGWAVGGRGDVTEKVGV
eukprot:scaffold10237_cov79-Isochrysis_galbana.AAC.2